MHTSSTALDFAMIRRPLLPLRVFHEWRQADDPAIYALEAFKSPLLAEALYLASRSLHQRLRAVLDDPSSISPEERRNLGLALSKYLARAAFRSTPFGLFAYVQSADVGDATSRRPGAVQRCVNLDGGVEAKVMDELASRPEVRRDMDWIFNSTYTIIRGTERASYVQVAKTEDGKRKFIASEVEHDWVIDRLKAFCSSVRRYADIDDFIAAEHSASEAERSEYIGTLIEEGLLLPFLGGVTTQRCVLSTLQAQITHPDTAARISVAAQALASSQAIDPDVDAVERVVRYEALSESLAGFIDERDRAGDVVQVDAYAPEPGTVSQDLADRVARVCGFLNDLDPRRHIGLRQFAQQFEARFEGAEVPLVMALDQDWGIAFPDKSRLPSPLLEGLTGANARTPGGHERTTNKAFWREVTQRAIEALIAHKDEVVFTADELQRFALPPSPVTVRTAGWAQVQVIERGHGRVPELVLANTFGATGMEMMGRFCLALPDSASKVRRVFAQREQENREVIHAEILHQPQDRLLNITRRPRLSEYEIVLSGISELPRERQIWMEDLAVGVQGGRVLLRHLPTGRLVQPRLTCAHNHFSAQLGVYQFLAALANVDAVNRSFEWLPSAANLRRTPRVVFDSVVVARARWKLDAKDLATLRQAHRDGSVAQWRAEREIPRHVTVGLYDLALPVDFDWPHSVAIALEDLEEGSEAQLFESLAMSGPDAESDWEERETFEVVLPLEFGPKPQAVTEPAPLPLAATDGPVPTSAPSIKLARLERDAWDLASNTRGSFDRWVYAKVYVGAAHADKVLREELGPVMVKAHHDGLIDAWFFIRFTDSSGDHLRIRFHSEHRERLFEVQARFAQAVERARGDLRVVRVTYDDYQPELARYGGQRGLAVCERLFHMDSEDACFLLGTVDQQEQAPERWLAALAALDIYADDLQLADGPRAEILKTARDAFVAEQIPHGAARFQLGARFRSKREFVDALTRGVGKHAHSLEPWTTHLRSRSPVRRQLMHHLDEALAGFDTSYRRSVLRSLLHMQLNRLFPDQQRAYEAVLYDFLVRIDESRAAMARGRARREGVTA